MQNTKKQHILVIPSWYPCYPGDIGGSFFREQAIALKMACFKVGVIFPQMRSLKNILETTNGVKKEVDDGVNTYRDSFLNFTPRCNSIMQKNWLKRGEKLFELYIKDNDKPDLIHAHSLFNGGLLAHRLNKKYNIPFVIAEHSSAFLRGLVSDNQVIHARSAVNDAAYCIAVSNELGGVLNGKFKTKKWIYIPNIVSKAFLDADFKKISNNESGFRFINICFLEKNKRVDILIRAFDILCRKFSNIELEIGGVGPELRNLKKLTRRLGLEDKIRFHGRLTRSEVLERVSDADAFVLSSDYETFGIVVIEALALGKPVIATKCGGPESIVTGDVGFLVDKNSPGDLASAMALLHKNGENYNPRRIRDYCVREFSEGSVIRRLAVVYNNILKGKM